MHRMHTELLAVFYKFVLFCKMHRMHTELLAVIYKFILFLQNAQDAHRAACCVFTCLPHGRWTAEGSTHSLGVQEYMAGLGRLRPSQVLVGGGMLPSLQSCTQST